MFQRRLWRVLLQLDLYSCISPMLDRLSPWLGRVYLEHIDSRDILSNRPPFLVVFLPSVVLPGMLPAEYSSTLRSTSRWIVLMKAKPIYKATPTRNILKTSWTYPDATYGKSGSEVHIDDFWLLLVLVLAMANISVCGFCTESSSLSVSYFVGDPVMYARRGFWIRFFRTASWYLRVPRIFSYCDGRRGGTSGESSGRGDSPADETSISLFTAVGDVFRGVKKSEENLLRLKVGVEENRNDPPSPLLTGAMFPNCFDAVFNCFGGLSVAFSGPAKVKRGLRERDYVSL